MTLLWVACIILIGQGLIAISIRRAVRTFGVYSEKLKATHDLNVEIRKNLAIQKNEEAITYLLDNPTEREA